MEVGDQCTGRAFLRQTSVDGFQKVPRSTEASGSCMKLSQSKKESAFAFIIMGLARQSLDHSCRNLNGSILFEGTARS